jgi:hypothetical protein
MYPLTLPYLRSESSVYPSLSTGSFKSFDAYSLQDCFRITSLFTYLPAKQENPTEEQQFNELSLITVE